MLTIQYFLLILVLLITLRTIAKFRAKDLGLKGLLFWLGLWLAIGVVVVYPKTASLLALQLGVGRGADLVIYLSLIMVFYLLFRIMMRLEKMEAQITKIVTKVALKEEKKDL